MSELIAAPENLLRTTLLIEKDANMQVIVQQRPYFGHKIS